MLKGLISIYRGLVGLKDRGISCKHDVPNHLCRFVYFVQRLFNHNFLLL